MTRPSWQGDRRTKRTSSPPSIWSSISPWRFIRTVCSRPSSELIPGRKTSPSAVAVSRRATSARKRPAGARANQESTAVTSRCVKWMLSASIRSFTGLSWYSTLYFARTTHADGAPCWRFRSIGDTETLSFLFFVQTLVRGARGFWSSAAHTMWLCEHY
jgi:hypothetical protein